MRLWSGCIETSKAIALETKDGPNTVEQRQNAFFQIEPFSKSDLIYAAGLTGITGLFVTSAMAYFFK